ncbi:MFS transporter [Secundilactobacillus hailunensis]|uniref:MFS transporter n=1 Tax=Secundilactobacillus hailunensis TaxID=2559923 RepID=A0ABW1TBW5_9LACO|nr:MFS transporter [Secundilactobacillus hailunensis]
MEANNDLQKHSVTSKNSKFPSRLGLALLIGPAGWLGSYVGLAATLLPSQIGVINPAHKVALVALFSTVAMTVSTIANIVFGALSDMTRSKHGRRTPWIIGNSLVSAIFLVLLAFSKSIMPMLFMWALFEIASNGVVAPMVAQISDRVPKKWQGSISSFYAVGMAVGNYGSGVIAAQFLNSVQKGIVFFAGWALILGLISAWLAHEPSNVEAERTKVSAKELLANFKVPTHNAKDYYMALVGKLLMVTGQYIIVGYQLYILKDYMKLNASASARTLTIMSTCLMITGIFCPAIIGPITDKLHRVKLPVAITTGLLGVGAFLPFLDPKPWTMIAYGVIAGIGMGCYSSVDQVLNIQVLPSKQNAAKDLGIINLANTAGMVLGPIVAALIISVAGYHAIFPVETLICFIGGGIIMLIKSVK